MRCFDIAGKLQFGTIYQTDGKNNYLVKFTLDRDALIHSKEGSSFLIQTIEEWENQETEEKIHD